MTTGVRVAPFKKCLVPSDYRVVFRIITVLCCVPEDLVLVFSRGVVDMSFTSVRGCVTTCGTTARLRSAKHALKNPSVGPRPQRPCVTVKASDKAETQSPADESYYDILMIEPMAADNRETLRANYRRLQKSYHPDVYKDGGERSQLLNTAYETLMDPTKRMEYDRGIG
eukprot:1554884-Pyramimonas_sp.AAC.1